MLVIRDPREVWKIVCDHCQRFSDRIILSRRDKELIDSVIEDIYEERAIKRLGDLFRLSEPKKPEPDEGHSCSKNIWAFMKTLSLRVRDEDLRVLHATDAILDMYFLGPQSFLTIFPQRGHYRLTSTNFFEKKFGLEVDLELEQTRVADRMSVAPMLDDGNWMDLLE